MPKRKICFLLDEHESMAKKYVGTCIICEEKIGPSWSEFMAETAEALPLKTRQDLISALLEGKTIGEARKIVKIDDLDLGVALHVITNSIVSNQFLQVPEE